MLHISSKSHLSQVEVSRYRPTGLTVQNSSLYMLVSTFLLPYYNYNNYKSAFNGFSSVLITEDNNSCV